MKQSRVIYDPMAECPLWESAVAKWMCGDRELVEFLQVALGVTLTSDTNLQCLSSAKAAAKTGRTHS
jgi:putative DNA primase/helicase